MKKLLLLFVVCVALAAGAYAAASEAWIIENGLVTAAPAVVAGDVVVGVSDRPIYCREGIIARHCLELELGDVVILGGRLPPIDADEPRYEAEYLAVRAAAQITPGPGEDPPPDQDPAPVNGR